MMTPSEKYMHACQLIDDDSEACLKEATHILERLVVDGYIPAAHLLAAHYQHGIGCERNYALSAQCCMQAIRHYGEEANAGWWRLGMLYMEGGYGLEQDYTRAYECFDNYINNPEYSDEYRVGLCLHHMGLIHMNGWGRQMDNVRACAFFATATRFGYSKSNPLQTSTRMRLTLAELKEAQHETYWRYIKHRRFLDNAENRFIADMEGVSKLLENE